MDFFFKCECKKLHKTDSSSMDMNTMATENNVFLRTKFYLKKKLSAVISL